MSKMISTETTSKKRFNTKVTKYTKEKIDLEAKALFLIMGCVCRYHAASVTYIYADAGHARGGTVGDDTAGLGASAQSGGFSSQMKR